MNDTLSQGLTTIRLYGVLGKRFGRMHGRLLESGTVREAMSALKHTMEGFETFMREAESKGLTFAVFRGRTNLSGEQLDMRGREDIRIVPLVIGSKQSGLFQTVLGAALIAVGVFATSLTLGTSTFLISAGASMMLGGVMQMLSPQPKGLKGREARERPSYAFGGPVNTIAQGHPVGVLYGKRRIGGAVISAGIYAEDRL